MCDVESKNSELENYLSNVKAPVHHHKITSTEKV
jgi:hypothetical protein